MSYSYSKGPGDIKVENPIKTHINNVSTFRKYLDSILTAFETLISLLPLTVRENFVRRPVQFNGFSQKP